MMIRESVKFLPISAAIVLSSSMFCYGYDEKQTHPAITLKAIESSSVGQYLKQNYGTQLQDGFESYVNGKRVRVWFTKGSELEDTVVCRRANHFHNPLLPWEQSGMSDDPLWAESGCTFWTRYSAVTWGTGYLSPAPDGAKQMFPQWPDIREPNTWDNARKYFYLALTSGSSEMREINFTKTFQAVGQVMHLVQDMAVPAHVRNDFESHLLSINTDFFVQPFERYISRKSALVTNLQSIPMPSFADTSVTKFWDTDAYTGSNPSTSWSIGLSEFTNANYFSDYTIPSNGVTRPHLFPNPFVTSAGYEICEEEATGPLGITYKKKYISRKGMSANGCDHFGRVSPMMQYWACLGSSACLNANIPNVALVLDDNVHETYAQELLPRAVGYSAGLLNYFFRGQLSLVPAGETMDQYALINSSTEDVSGTFSLYYDDESSNRILIAKWENITIGPAIQNGQQAIPGQSALVTFPTPTTPAPKEKNTYFLVFQGRMGTEEGAVTGKAVRWWREEWDNGLTGNHAWVQTRFGAMTMYPATEQSHRVDNGRLIKENSGVLWSNNSYIGTPSRIATDPGGNRHCYFGEYPLDCAFADVFPYAITPATRINLRIDTMDVNQEISGPCNGGWVTGAYQGVVVKARMGDGSTRSINFTTRGNESYTAIDEYVPLGEDFRIAFYDVLAKAGPVLQPVFLDSISVVQNILCDAVAHTEQRLVVDYIRLEER